MAKGQVTEKDLELGLKKAGGFSGLAKKARRDSPFGQEHAKPVADAQNSEPKKVSKRVNSEKTIPEKAVEKVIEVKRAPKQEAKQQLKSTSQNDDSIQKAVTTKAEAFSERITLNITPDMRDKAEMIARGLQRRKADRTERITANTIYRVAIEALLANEDFLKSISPNTEKELLDAVKAKK